MTYYKDITAEYEDIEDRYELMVERIRSITKEETVDMRYRDYFVRTGEFLLQLDTVIEKVKSGMQHFIRMLCLKITKRVIATMNTPDRCLVRK